MLSHSDSDSLPDLGQALADSRPSLSSVPVLNLKKLSENRTKRKRPSLPPSTKHSSPSHPHKKRKLQNTKANGKAKASAPIELTSEDEPNSPSVKPNFNVARKNRRPLPPDVIDLCSDQEATPKPPRLTQKSQSRPPREDEVIVLLSSDNDEPTSCLSPPVQPQTPPSKSPSPTSLKDNARHYTLPTSASVTATSVPCTQRLQTDVDDTAVGADGVPREPHKSTSPKPISTGRSSSSMSPVPLVHEAPLSTHPAEPVATETKADHPVEEEVSPGLLQGIYNEAFQNAPQGDEMDLPSSVFSSKSRSKPYPKIITHAPGAFTSESSSHPPLLTPSFFRRVQHTLSMPQHPTTPVQVSYELPSMTLSSVTPVQPTSGESSKIQSPKPRTDSRSQSPRLPTPRHRPEYKSMAMEEATEAVLLTETSSAEVAMEPNAHCPASRSPPAEPSFAHPPHQHEGEYTPTLPIQSIAGEMRANSPSSVDPMPSTITTPVASLPAPPPMGQVDSITSNEDIKPDVQMNDPGPETDSALDMQEIEDMLLPKTSHELTDEELLAIGLSYPGPDVAS